MRWEVEEYWPDCWVWVLRDSRNRPVLIDTEKRLLKPLSNSIWIEIV